MSVHLASAAHEATYQDLCSLLSRHKDLDAVEILAIAANMVGKLVAMQDQRKMTPAQAMEIVARNIEMGNDHILRTISNTRGQA